VRNHPWWSRGFESPETLPERYPFCCGTYWDTLLLSTTSTGTVVGDPTRSGNHVFAAHVAPNNGHDYADWSELTQNYITSHGRDGASVWVRLRFRFPKNFKPSGYTAGQVNTDWNWLVQFHETGRWSRHCSTENPGTIALGILNSRMRPLRENPRFRLHVLGGVQTGGKCIPNQIRVQGVHVRLAHWYSLLMHVNFSASDSGLVQLWLDRRLIFNVHGPNVYQHPDDGSVGNSYFAFGYYRLSSSWDATVYFDDVAEGPTRGSVVKRR
jgi:polysaccharide lyase-like protein